MATWCKELTYWKRPWCWERVKPGEGDNREWDDWMASLTQWTWVWVNLRNWWWTGRPGLLQSMGSQRVGHDWTTELNWIEIPLIVCMRFLYSESVSGLCSVHFHLTPDNSGLNWVGSLIYGYFSVANTTVGGLWLVEPEDAEEPQIQSESVSCLFVSNSFVTPWTVYSPPVSSNLGILHVRILEWAAVPLSRNLPNSGIKLQSSTLQADSLPSEPHCGQKRCLEWFQFF